LLKKKKRSEDEKGSLKHLKTKSLSHKIVKVIHSHRKFLAITIASIILILGVLFGFVRISQAGDIDLEVNIVGEEEETGTPVGGGGMPAGPTPPEGGFRILINDDAKYTNSPAVTLKLFGGTNTEKMAISNNPEFGGTGSTGQIAYQSSYQWNLCWGKEACKEGEYTVYAKFYTSWGTASEVVSDRIIYKKSIPEWIIEQIQNKINEISEKIADLRKQITQLFKKEIVTEVPESPPEEIVPPERPPEKIVPPLKEVKEGPIYLLKEYGKWLWQSVQVLFHKTWLGWQKVWPFK